MHNVLLIFCILSNFVGLSAQQVPTWRNKVIATTGLNMRDTPDLSGEVITKVPYLATVKILEQSATNYFDTVGYLKNTLSCPLPYAPYYSENENCPIVGQWVLAKYQNYTGYIFSAYLDMDRGHHYISDYILSANSPYNGLNQQVRFADRSGNIGNDFDIHDYYWYGVFKTDTLNYCQVEISRITPILTFHFDEFESWTKISDISDNQHIIYYIGTKQPLTVGKHAAWHVDYYLTSSSSRTKAQNEFFNNTIHEIRPPQPISSWEVESMTFFSSSESLQLPLIDGYPVHWLDFIGDLDGDGKDDYIITEGCKETCFHMILYLSTFATANRPADPVALQVHFTD